MPKHAYLRADGQYDLYDVEPKTITAAEYATMKKREELMARQEQLLVSRNKIDAELATVTNQIKALTNPSAEPSEAVTAVTNTTAEPSARRKW